MDLEIRYLDLAIPKTNRKATKLDQFRHNCYFINQFKHNIHSDNSQLNTFIDMLIALEINLEKQDKYLAEINTYIHENIVSKNNISKNLFNKIEYVKNQSNDIIRTLGQSKHVSIHRNTFEKTITKLDKRYKDIR